MLSSAYQKNTSIAWGLGNVEAIPFQNGSFSGAICVLAIHHFVNLQLVFNEVARVLSSGRFVIFTATADQMRGYWLNEYFPRAMKKSIDQMPGKNEIIEALQNAGFRNIQMEPYEIRDDLEDLFLYSGKHRPGIYLDSQIRMGISTFAALADSNEIERGGKLLEADIRSGRLNEVIAYYGMREAGDYLFVVGRKN